MKLIGKIFISGQIETLTGLHIGGSKTALEIGGVDLNVIKTPDGVPFIPGSSLKGKLRALLAREAGSEDVSKDSGTIKTIFGHADKIAPFKTRLIVRDAKLNVSKFDTDFPSHKMEFPFTDIKWENRIKRTSGTAIDPRQLERVPAGVFFDAGFVYDVYDSDLNNMQQYLNNLHLAFKLLHDDYLGGQGSRGYGQVAFRNFTVTYKSLINGVYQVETPNNEEIQSFIQAIEFQYGN